MKPWHLLSILALCVALVATVPAASASYDHPFILKWGERGIDTPGEFSNPKYVAVDSEGSVYVTDLGNKRGKKIQNRWNFYEKL